MNVWERKRLAARDAIGEAAMTLALDKGFDAVRVEDIARVAAVSPRTFNNYFSSKEAAVVSVAFSRASQLTAEFAARPASEDLWHALGSAFAQVFPPNADWQRQARLIRETPALAAEQLKAFAAIELELAGEIARRTGARADDLDSRLAAAAAVTTVRVVTDHFLVAGFDETFVQTLQDTLTRFGTGLSAHGS